MLSALNQQPWSRSRLSKWTLPERGSVGPRSPPPIPHADWQSPIRSSNTSRPHHGMLAPLASACEKRVLALPMFGLTQLSDLKTILQFFVRNFGDLFTICKENLQKFAIFVAILA